MKNTLPLDYHYGNEAEQYNFYRIPKVLFTDHRFKVISAEAKILYGLMLDRMGLSIRNGWLDESNRVYIYFTLEDAMKFMGCGHNKIVAMLAELDTNKGIGLIERKKQGQGKPTIIYVKNFTTIPLSQETPPSSKEKESINEEMQTSENGKSNTCFAPAALATEGDFSNCVKPVIGKEVKTSENRKSAFPENGSLDFPKSDTNNTKLNNTDLNDTELSINLSASTKPQEVRNVIDRMDEMDIYKEIIKKNVGYEILHQKYPHDHESVNGLIDLMLETVCTTRNTIRVGQEDIPTEIVKSRMLKLNGSHLEYVLDSLQRNATKIYNIRAYLLTSLFRSPTTISSYFTAQVNHDMANGFGSG